MASNKNTSNVSKADLLEALKGLSKEDLAAVLLAKEAEQPAEDPSTEGLPYVILRCDKAGVHAGYLKGLNDRGDKHVLVKARRIWYWDGAASISELAVYGPNPAKVSNCRFAVTLPLQELQNDDVIETNYCTENGRKAIQAVPEWRA